MSVFHGSLARVLARGALASIPLAAASQAHAQEKSDDPFAPFVAAASDEGAQAMARFKLPEGWKVELVAAEPLLANPVCFYLDHDGKTAYVGETFRHHKGVTDIRDHMDWNDDDLAARTVEDRVAYFKKHLGDKFADFEKACERVRLLRDTDGDGVFDSARVFSDRFRDAAAGIGASLLSYRGDVFYTCIPSLWRLRDKNGDGRADEETELSTGYGVHVALLGHDLHGLRIGPDGLLYFSIGDRGFNVPLPDGKRIEYPQSGAVLRCNLDGTNLEVFANGLRNPQDLVFDALGNLFTGDNNSDGGDKARLVHVVEGSDSGWRQAYQWITEPDMRGPWNDEKQWHPYPENQVAAILPPIANFADGPSGLTIDPGTGMDRRFPGWLFLADFRGGASSSGVRGFELVPKGAGFTLGEQEQIWWGVLATDVDVGPDGALYVSDWTEGWNQTGKGRLYRAFDPAVRDSAPVRETKRLLAEGFDQRETEELATLLGHADQRVRQEAQFALVRKGPSSALRLEQLATSSTARLVRLHAIWGLGMLLRQGAGRGPDVLMMLMSSPDAEVRAQCARVLGDAREAAATPIFVQSLRDPAPRVRMYAAIGLSRIGAADCGPALIEFAAATPPEETVLRHCASLAMSTCMQPAELSALTTHASLVVRLAAVVALRRQENDLVRVFLHDEDPAVALEAARAIYDVPIEGGMKALALLMRKRGDEYAFQRRAINANFRLGGHGEALALTEFVLRKDVSLKLRREAMLRLAQWANPPSRDPVVGAWRPIGKRDATFLHELVPPIALYSELVAEPELAQDWIRACVDNRVITAVDLLVDWIKDESLPGAVRADAVRGFIALMDSPDLPPALRPMTGTLVSMMVATSNHEVRAAAMAELPKIAPEQALELAVALLRDGDLHERRAALKALGQIDTPEAVDALGGQLDRQIAGLFPTELALDLALAAEKHDSSKLKRKLSALRAPRETEPALAAYVDSLYGGDAKRGRKLFREKSELVCLRCHKIEDGEGGDVGPDLVGLGSRSTRADMLEAICDPNRAIAQGFRNTILFLNDDTHLEGRVVSQDSKQIVLIDALAKLHEVELSEIAERREGQSAMPADLVKHISREEMRDLIEYLSRL